MNRGKEVKLSAINHKHEAVPSWYRHNSNTHIGEFVIDDDVESSNKH